jgi:hypothetical protein
MRILPRTVFRRSRRLRTFRARPRYRGCAVGVRVLGACDRCGR